MSRSWMLGLAGVCVFAIVAVVMVNVMPAPLKESDYMVAGTVATLASLLVLFLAVISTAKSRDVFFKKRRK
jgi:multisubunit Na+/H+ antiporter MnhB subunit